MRTIGWSANKLCCLLQIFLPFHFFDVTSYHDTRYKQDRQRNIETRPCSYCCSGKTNITYSECLSVDLGIQQAMGTRRIFICELFGFTILSDVISWTARLKKNCIEYDKCVSTFSTDSVWNISHSRKKWARCDQKCILVFTYSARYPCQILMKQWIFSIDFRKILKISNFMKIRLVEAELFYADGQTWRS